MTLAIAILLYGAAGIALICTWSMLWMRDEYQMMHFISPPASVSVILITIAVFLQRGMKGESFEAAFVAIVLMLMNAVVTHATGRAFRIREVRQAWKPAAGEQVPELPGDEAVPTPAGR